MFLSHLSNRTNYNKRQIENPCDKSSRVQPLKPKKSFFMPWRLIQQTQLTVFPYLALVTLKPTLAVKAQRQVHTCYFSHCCDWSRWQFKIQTQHFRRSMIHFQTMGDVPTTRCAVEHLRTGSGLTPDMNFGNSIRRRADSLNESP